MKIINLEHISANPSMPEVQDAMISAIKESKSRQRNALFQ
jgi:hypothetical protein